MGLDMLMASDKRLIDIFEASVPKVQRTMMKAFAMPFISIAGFPENTLEMRDSRTGKLLAKVVNIEGVA